MWGRPTTPYKSRKYVHFNQGGRKEVTLSFSFDLLWCKICVYTFLTQICATHGKCQLCLLPCFINNSKNPLTYPTINSFLPPWYFNQLFISPTPATLWGRTKPLKIPCSPPMHAWMRNGLEYQISLEIITLLPRIWLMAADSLRVHSAWTTGLISFM